MAGKNFSSIILRRCDNFSIISQFVKTQFPKFPLINTQAIQSKMNLKRKCAKSDLISHFILIANKNIWV